MTAGRVLVADDSLWRQTLRVGRGAQRAPAVCVGNDRRVHPSQDKRMGQQQCAGRTIGFGSRRLAARNIETRDDENATTVAGEMGGGGGKVAGAERLKFLLGGDQPTTGRVATDETVEFFEQPELPQFVVWSLGPSQSMRDGPQGDLPVAIGRKQHTTEGLPIPTVGNAKFGPSRI